MSQPDVVLEALIDEVQNLKAELSKVWAKINGLQMKIAEMDSRWGDATAKAEAGDAKQR